MRTITYLFMASFSSPFWPLSSSAANANDLSCAEVSTSIRMINSESLASLELSHFNAVESYRTNLIYRFRKYELSSNNVTSAKSLMEILPKNDKQYSIWMTMGDDLCPHESLAQMKFIDRFSEKFSTLLTKAALIFTDGIPSYVKFSILALQDPHSDLTTHMRDLCISQHDLFVRAVDQLSHEDKKTFSKYVMDESECKVLNFPEAD